VVIVSWPPDSRRRPAQIPATAAAPAQRPHHQAVLADAGGKHWSVDPAHVDSQGAGGAGRD